MATKSQTPPGISYDTKVIITVITLVTVYPVGIILMWLWTRWPLWVKILLSLFIFLPIVAVLLAITLIAINPAKQFSQADNTERRSEINAILFAVQQYRSDHDGQLPTHITNTPTEISSDGANICSDLIATYLAALPVDPQMGKATIVDCTAPYDTGYVIASTNKGQVTVSAPHAALNEAISVTR